MISTYHTIQVIKVASYSITVYLQVLVVNMALNQTWIALLIFVLAGFPTLAFRLSPVISSVAGFTSGFFIPRDSMPPWYVCVCQSVCLYFTAVTYTYVLKYLIIECLS